MIVIIIVYVILMWISLFVRMYVLVVGSDFTLRLSVGCLCSIDDCVTTANGLERNRWDSLPPVNSHWVVAGEAGATIWQYRQCQCKMTMMAKRKREYFTHQRE